MKLIGIDIGGTHTRVRVADSASTEVADTRLPTAGWLGPAGLRDPEGAGILLSHARALGADQHAALTVGAHGCDSEAQIQAFRAALELHHLGPLLVLNDALLVGPAAGYTDAVGIIAGTGSIVVGRTPNGEHLTAGGYGWMIGDPGSAPGIARESMRAVQREHDTGKRPGLLARRLMEHFAASTVDDLSLVFTHSATMHRWAEAAPVIFAAASDGSRLARRVIGTAADELATSVGDVLGRHARADAIVAAGGVVTAQPLLQSELGRALTDQGIDLPFVVLHDEPVAGAIALARTLI
ncbi:N-acetylglucosamine kinase [Leucobacter chromiiresistens]|uniref:BadF-type ATPase n=1 Tax=Leucobacter chromiiresistens TaxID=1079994 RepID=A0A1H0YKC8_9MICO|nr:BadF/BadG/BcrA/BcrD ATPase family protein [Leucobacter chromiiresistens]SDQ15593.1 BadF-type ATPase [Leucobacter chromiiresistens]